MAYFRVSARAPGSYPSLSSSASSDLVCNRYFPGEAKGSGSHKPFHTSLVTADIALKLESLLKNAEQRMARERDWA